MKAVFAKVSNRGSIPESFLNELVKWGKIADDQIFASRNDDPNETDIYTSVKAQLGPYESLIYRKAVMLEVMRVLAGFESSWKWDLGYDTHNPDENSSTTKSAGAFQVSANSTFFGSDLKAIAPKDGEAFQSAMKTNHKLAMEYIARLLRHTIRHNGPVKRKEIHPYLSKEAVKEFIILLGENLQEILPKPIEPIVEDVEKVDQRSETNILTLHPKVQPLARSLVLKAAKQNIKAVVTSGSRTYAEQDALYAQGRTKPGPRITNAKGGQSWHNFALAFDITVFVGKEPKYEGPEYKKLGAIGKELNLEWGGDWKGNLVDEPHFQFNPHGYTLAQMREKKQAGIDAFA